VRVEWTIVQSTLALIGRTRWALQAEVVGTVCIYEIIRSTNAVKLFFVASIRIARAALVWKLISSNSYAGINLRFGGSFDEPIDSLTARESHSITIQNFFSAGNVATTIGEFERINH
jgi:hypothetical protein